MRTTSTSRTPPPRGGESAQGSTCKQQAQSRCPGAGGAAEGLLAEGGEEGAEAVAGEARRRHRRPQHKRQVEVRAVQEVLARREAEEEAGRLLTTKQ